MHAVPAPSGRGPTCRRAAARLPRVKAWLALVAAWLAAASAAGATAPAGEAAAPPEILRVEVLAAYPHDPRAFTQGLVLHEGRLYESTGLVGQSSLREVELVTGRVLRRVDVPPPLFAEGIAVVGTRLFQLTWQDRVALVYDLASLVERERLSYPTEGWGLCASGTTLVMSDGTDRLFLRDAGTFDAVGLVHVREAGRPVAHLNELECVGADVYANVWQTEDIVRIDRRTGRVRARIRATGLLTEAERQAADVMNGIAYDPASDTFLLTGKFWPRLFRVRFVPAARGPG